MLRCRGRGGHLLRVSRLTHVGLHFLLHCIPLTLSPTLPELIVMESVNSPFSIAQDLPFDVLHDVFECYLLSEDLKTRSHRIFLLCHICMGWRNASLKMTSLWTSTTFTLHTIRRLEPPFTLYIHPKSSMLISWWKEHLGGAAPSIHLSRPPQARSPPSHGIEIDTLQDAYATFFSGTFFRSARSLILELINQELDIICSDQTPFPNLLDFRIENNPNFRIPRIPVSAFPSAPLLARLHLSHADLFKERLLKIFPWAQLTHLYIPRTIPHDCCKLLLELCTSLRLAAFILPNEHMVPGPGALNSITANSTPDDTSVIRHLRHLVLASSGNPASLSLSGLHLPALSALRISSPGVSIKDIDQLCALLAATPALKELHFDNILSFADNANIRFDTGAGARTLSGLVPRLQHLVVDYIDPSRQNVGQNIIRFLQSAWLCAGWAARDANGAPIQRRLKFIIENDSYIESLPVPDEIVAEVKRYLGEEWHLDSPFEVSIQDAESLGVPRYIFDVFDEKLPGRGWDGAVGFYDKL